MLGEGGKTLMIMTQAQLSDPRTTFATKVRLPSTAHGEPSATCQPQVPGHR
jgi:hypothetical protein